LVDRERDKKRIPGLFTLAGLESAEPSFPKIPAPEPATEYEFPLHQWVFGQLNRLLPAKASCRGLAHLLKEFPQGVQLSVAAARIAEEAAALGMVLDTLDRQNSQGRDDALATAFPKASVDAGKGKMRYANQFVGSASKDGKLSGLLISLRFIDNEPGKDPLIKLSEAGWNFAILPNPVLDGPQEKAGKKFSDDEVGLFLDHINRNVPEEAFAYRTLLSAIEERADTPEKIDIYLQDKEIWWRDRPTSTGRQFLSSQRSGAISRMADLGLVKRKREGVRVTYIITESGEAFLARVANQANDKDASESDKRT
jgi:hypothetical protein